MGGAAARPGLQGGMVAGLLIGLAILALAVVLRAGMAGWIALMTAMVVFSLSPDQGLRAVAIGAATWTLLSAVRRGPGR